MQDIFYKVNPRYYQLICYSDGSIFSINKDRFLTTKSVKNRGYIRLTLACGAGSRYKREFAHRLIAETFLGPIPDGMQVNHINGVKYDNRIENLEYLAAKENIQHAHKNGLVKKRRGEKCHLHILKKEQIKEIKRLRSTGLTQIYIAKIFNTSQSNISFITRNITWKNE